jgi:hypothetical protein
MPLLIEFICSNTVCLRDRVQIPTLLVLMTFERLTLQSNGDFILVIVLHGTSQTIVSICHLVRGSL